MHHNKLCHTWKAGLLAVLLMLGSGCSDNESPLPAAEDENAMSFNVMHPRQAATNTRVTSTAFEAATTWAYSSPVRMLHSKYRATMSTMQP